MICITTRFHLRHFWQLIPIYFLYRSMLSGLQTTPGLIRYTFLFETPTYATPSQYGNPSSISKTSRTFLIISMQ